MKNISVNLSIPFIIFLEKIQIVSAFRVQANFI